jgi:Rrf2 family cysteine metabolism transcriptional repressor
MNISSKSRYAVSALAGLELHSRGSAPVSVHDLARERDLPAKFLEQVFATLRRNGILRSHRGLGGGFTLARRPERITVLEVVMALDGRPSITACDRGECDLEGECGSSALWREALLAFEEVLATTTIADLAERELRERGDPFIYEI